MTGAAPLHIVCAYRDGMLTGEWFQAYRRLKRMLRRGGYDAVVELLPDRDVRDESALIVIPGSSAPPNPARAGEVVAIDVDAAQAAFDALIERLVAEGRLGRAPARARTSAVHRGFQALQERARLSE